VGDFSGQLSPMPGEFFLPSFLLLLALHCLASCFYDYLKHLLFAWADGFTLFQLGFLMLWNSPAINWPTFSETVPKSLYIGQFLPSRFNN
jgi:xanthine/uracil/vitamin C permease (AzgA family)